MRIRYVYFALRKCFIHRGQFLNDSRSSLRTDGLACRQAGAVPVCRVWMSSCFKLNILRFIFEFYVRYLKKVLLEIVSFGSQTRVTFNKTRFSWHVESLLVKLYTVHSAGFLADHLQCEHYYFILYSLTPSTNTEFRCVRSGKRWSHNALLISYSVTKNTHSIMHRMLLKILPH